MSVQDARQQSVKHSVDACRRLRAEHGPRFKSRGDPGTPTTTDAAQLCAVATAAARLMRLCGVVDPWVAFHVLRRAPRLLAADDAALTVRLIELRAALPGARLPLLLPAPACGR